MYIIIQQNNIEKAIDTFRGYVMNNKTQLNQNMVNNGKLLLSMMIPVSIKSKVQI